jgi:cellulose synthase/poly-beta-1,6-N-acetylglucosamine synthase-like glycosyltransferase/peptidoglycan/xylan/chitin deacetylase (PgdA/CDA1 family)/spore germination protein YaaH
MQQVFQSQNSTRWNQFVWLFRILIVFFCVGAFSILISLFHKQKYNTRGLIFNERIVQNINKDTSKEIIPDSELVVYEKHLKQLRGRKKDFYKSVTVRPNSTTKEYLPVRAGFYVNWDDNSFYSLQSNIGKLNMVLPEWMFQRDTRGNIDTQIDDKALNTLRKNHIAIIPMLSNNYNQRWNGDSTLLLLKNKSYRNQLINNVKKTLTQYHLQGINIDLESLPTATYPYLLAFSEELYQSLHPSGYLITIDVNPFDKDLDFKKIAQFYDFIFLMAYDEHYPESTPGCVSSINFIEKSLDAAMKEVPSEKFVLCIAGYGYNWEAGSEGTDISYEDFISLANEYKVPVKFSESHSDLYIKYNDENNNPNEAHCNDIVSIYNAIRTAEDYNTAGVALWYLGCEDYRIWNFYNRVLSIDSLTKHPLYYQQLENIRSMYSVNFDGKGEILEVISSPKPGEVKLTIDTVDQMIAKEQYLNLPSSYLVRRYGDTPEKKIAITFDDGPDEDYTPQILDILKEKKAVATFFVTGLNIEQNIPIVQRIYKEGHEIGNHTFTHPNLEVTSDDRERIELRSTRLLLESILEHTTLLFRPPYNTDAEPRTILQIRPLAVATEEGYLTVASSIDPNDWQKGVTADTIVSRAVAQLSGGNILLLHDAGGERSQTVKALPRIIDYYRQKGYQFVTISNIIGTTRDQVMPAVQGKMKYTEAIDYVVFLLTFLWEHFLHGFFIVTIFLGISRLITLLVLAVLQNRKFKNEHLKKPDFWPSVSIIVPAYNEEVNVRQTIENLLKTDYPNVEIIFVDDGSKDQTFNIVKTAFGNHPNVSIYTKPNGGKASSLNLGISKANGEILVCIDADTLLLPGAISNMVPYFEDTHVAAVAGNVRVGNTINFLTNWQKIEYTTSQNFDRLAFDYANAILVVPGAIGAFRKTALEAIGGFSTDTMAEDCDLTIRLLREGDTVHTCNNAISLTEAPETLKMFIKQRFRWSFGMMQSFWKHRDLLFSRRKPNIGWILLPNLLIFGFIIPLFSPFVDILFVAGLFTTHAKVYIIFYILFFVVDWIVAVVAYHYDKQRFSIYSALMLFIQRFIYRQILFYVLLKAYLSAIKGELANWGVLKRTGNVKL